MSEQLNMLGEPDYKPGLQQWHTPPKLADKMASWAKLGGCTVLEPSAGGGALVRAALDHGATHVTAVELDPEWCERLRERFAYEVEQGIVRVVEADFLEWAKTSSGWYAFRNHMGPFDLTLSNVPFDSGLDGRFLEAMFRHARRHIALTNNTALHGVEKYERIWAKAHLHRQANLVRRPVFSGAFGGGMKDMVVTSFGPLTKYFSETHVEWWPESWT